MYNKIKRIFDIIVSLTGIILTSPLWFIAIIGIEISDPGPIFYKANRVGKDNKVFKMYKFRSMTVDKNADEKSFKADTSRIFKFGAFMRSSKIDELPQLINVYEGTMSLVGPRPAAKDQVDITRGGKYKIASTVKPGLTGPAALYDYIYGDSVEDPDDYERLVLPTRLELEAYYPAHMNAFYDLKIIFYTVICILCSLMGKFPARIYNELVRCVND